MFSTLRRWGLIIAVITLLTLCFVGGLLMSGGVESNADAETEEWVPKPLACADAPKYETLSQEAFAEAQDYGGSQDSRIEMSTKAGVYATWSLIAQNKCGR